MLGAATSTTATSSHVSAGHGSSATITPRGGEADEGRQHPAVAVRPAAR